VGKLRLPSPDGGAAFHTKIGLCLAQAAWFSAAHAPRQDALEAACAVFDERVLPGVVDSMPQASLVQGLG
jgi:hypothetical protein